MKLDCETVKLGTGKTGLRNCETGDCETGAGTVKLGKLDCETVDCETGKLGLGNY